MANYVITAAQVKWLGGEAIREAIAGVAIAAGEAISVDPATGKMVLADADFVGQPAVMGPMIGLALTNAAAGQPIFYAPSGALVQLSTGAAIDISAMPVFLSTTPGKLMPHTDLSTGYTTLVGFLTDAATRRNIQLAIARADWPYAD